MDRERWQQIDRLFEAALARPTNDRSAFLDEACAGDPQLREEVESLLTHEKSNNFLNDPAFSDATRVLADDARHLIIGQTIGGYQILQILGAGGMGEVYLALHLRTNRKVALKRLPATFTRDEQRVQRFQQEARAVLALNHPNIVTVYDIEQAGETHLIATEVIEGETLRRRLSRAPLNLGEALDVAIQIVGALVAAHNAGVIHRDIKPENIMLRPDGFVKVLDFGLAKLTEQPIVNGSSELPTRGMIRTDAGMVMGTANYMSPEQARGMEVDARTDIFSFGVVFFEMLTGNSPFAGKTNSDVMAAILQNDPPPLARYWPEAPESLEWIVIKALTKEKDERYQTAKELQTDLKRLKRRSDYEVEASRLGSTPSGDSPPAGQSSGAMVTPTAAHPVVSTPQATRTTMSSAEYVVSEIKRHKRTVIFAFMGLAVLAFIGVILARRYLGPAERGNAAKPFSQMKVTKLTTIGNASRAAISPDGKYVVHVTGGVGKQSVLLRHIATGSDKEIVAADGSDFSWLTFSRDGSYVLYSRSESGTYPLFKVPVLGGSPQKLLFDDVDTPVTFSPDGKRFAFMRGETQKGESSIFLANADGTNEQPLVKHKVSDFYPGSWPSPSWSPDGATIAFAHRDQDGARSTNVVVVRVTDGIEKQLTSQQWANVQALAWLTDGSGLIITASLPEATNIYQLWFVSYPDGNVRKITNDANNYVGLSLTGDSSALVTVQAEQSSNIWLAPGGDASRATQITSSGADGVAVIAFAPDGKVIYSSSARGRRDLWIINEDGTGQKQLLADVEAIGGLSISSDSRHIVYSLSKAGTSTLWRMDLDGGNQKQLTTGVRDITPSISPDGKSVFYTATESDMQHLRKVSIDGGDSVRITEYSASTPMVSADGKQILCGYIDEVKKRWSVAIIAAAGGPPIKTFEIVPVASRFQWGPDGRSLLYAVTQGGVSNIWSQPVDGGPAKQVTDFKSDRIFRFDWSRGGKWLVLARGRTTSDVVLMSELR